MYDPIPYCITHKHDFLLNVSFASLTDNGGADGGVTRQPSIRGGRITEDGVQLRPRRERRAGRTKLERQSTLIRQKVESLPTFFPFFILGITLIQSVATIVAIIIGGLAPIGILPNIVNDEAASLRNATFKAEIISYEEPFNPWIGAPIPFLITFGAKFTPCMREDHKINARNARIREQQLVDGGVGCCVNGNWYGSTSRSECAHSSMLTNDTDFIPGGTCKSNPNSQYASLVNFHPCCVSLTGRCELLLEIDCEQRDGVYHSGVELCSQVSTNTIGIMY